MKNWLRDVRYLARRYFLAGLLFVPFGLVYALGRLKHGDSYWILAVCLLGGFVTVGQVLGWGEWWRSK